MTKAFIDVETCGLYGMPVLLQVAFDDGPIELYSLWKMPILESMQLIERIASCEVIGFNLVFDWFHLSKFYSTICMFPDPEACPEDHINKLAVLEEKARKSDLCLKPFKALDLMLHARKGPFQSLMAREDIRIRAVPEVLANHLCVELEKRVQVDGIYFARRKDKHAPKWKTYDCRDRKTGKIRLGFKDVILKFSPSGALKVLAEYALGVKKTKKFHDVEVPKEFRPVEYGYAPFALAGGKPSKWNGTWPDVIKHHINHWHYHRIAREYAADDIQYTRDLYKYFGSPEMDDDDSVLACMVAAVRWRGHKIKVKSMAAMRGAARTKYSQVPLAPSRVRPFVTELMSQSEIEAMQGSTKKIVLERIAQSECDCVLLGENPRKCELCKGSKLHPSAARAKLVLEGRAAKKEEEIYLKLLKAGRFHASFVVIGTLSSRMAGADKLNPQGIKHTDEVRDCFPLADDGFILSGGDFDSFEVVLADAAYDDPALRADLKADRKIHALFAMELYGVSYEEVMKSKGTENDMYTAGKQGVFALIYGGDWNTLVQKQGISEEVAKAAYEKFTKKYPGIARARQRIVNMFCSMRQEVGGKVVWKEPADFIESLLGFRRYFTLENRICKALFDLAEKPPERWKDFKIKVVRRVERGAQFAHGAVRSALFGAAFAIQGAAMRAAANHVIQSTGATITKKVQRRIWDVQPAGVSKWRVVPLNIHDELMVPVRPEYAELVKTTVNETVETYRQRIPLIKMEWDIGLESWSKGMSEAKVRQIRQLNTDGKTLDEICKIMRFKDEGRGKAEQILAGEAWSWVE